MKVVIIIVVVIVLVAYLGISAYAAIAVTRIPRLPVEQSPDSFGLVYEDVSFPSREDNITLKGWFMPGGEFVVIVVNGGEHPRLEVAAGTLEMTKDLVDRGLSVLLFDQRGRGESEGKGLLLIKANQDIGGAVDYVRSRGHSHIVIIGLSLGAATALDYATLNDVTAIVADSCYSNVTEALIERIVYFKGIPEPIVRFFTPGMYLMAKIIYGYSKVNPVDIVSDVKCPILFIHGEADALIPVENAYELYQASGNPLDELWVIPGVEHCRAYKTDPVAYINRVTSFFEER